MYAVAGDVIILWCTMECRMSLASYMTCQPAATLRIYRCTVQHPLQPYNSPFTRFMHRTHALLFANDFYSGRIEFFSNNSNR